MSDLERADLIVTVLVSKELVVELGDWSPPVQVKIIRTPDVGTGYEMIARTVPEPTHTLEPGAGNG
jgi:hypothetical protein